MWLGQELKKGILVVLIGYAFKYHLRWEYAIKICRVENRNSKQRCASNEQ